MSTPPPQLTDALRGFMQRAQQSPAVADSTVARNVNLTFSFDGGGAPIAIGSLCYLNVDLPCRVSGWFIVADVAGSISFDINAGPFTDFPALNPMVGVGGASPATSGARSGSGDIAELIGWNTVVPKGTTIEVVCSSNDSISVATLSLRAKRLDLLAGQ